MQDTTLEHADTFFFVTTIAVVVGIIILCVILYFCIKAIRIIRNITEKTNSLLDKASQVAEDSMNRETPAKKSLGLVLPLLGMVFGKKKRKKTSDK